MKYVKLWLLAAGLLFVWGCENKGLIKCREDNQALQQEMLTLEDQVKQKNGQQEKMAAMLMDIQAKHQEEMKALQEANKEGLAAKEQSQAELQDVRRQLQTARELNEKMQKQLAEATVKVKNTGEMLLVQAQASDKLKARIDELEKQIAQLEKELEKKSTTGSAADKSGS